MAIHPGGTFHYEIFVDKDKESHKSKWTGKCRTTRDRSMHPGLLGYAPDFELSEGLVTLRSTEPQYVRRTNRHFRRNSPLASASFEIGDALTIAIQHSDLLHFHRSGTGDFGFSLIRNNKLILAVGAIVRLFLGSEIEVREDPRLRELRRSNDFFEHPPRDLCVKVLIQNQTIDLFEGQEVMVEPYHVFVERTYKVGMPGKQSILSIAQLSEKLTKETVISCTKRFSKPNEIHRNWERYRKPTRKWWQVWL